VSAVTPMFLESLTARRVEEAYQQANLAQRNQWFSFAATGWRAVTAKDPKLMKALEAMAERTYQLQEDQFGRTMRAPDATFAETKGTTEHQLCREAYRLADEGRPIRNFEWIYGAAAWLCGYI